MSLPTPAAPSPITVVPLPPAPASVAEPTPAPTIIDGNQAFVNLVTRISAAIPTKKITMEEVQKACSDAGIPSLPLLRSRTDLIPQVAMTIEALIASR